MMSNHRQVLEKAHQKSLDAATGAVSAFNLCHRTAKHTFKPLNHCKFLVCDDQIISNHRQVLEKAYQKSPRIDADGSTPSYFVLHSSSLPYMGRIWSISIHIWVKH